MKSPNRLSSGGKNYGGGREEGRGRTNRPGARVEEEGLGGMRRLKLEKQTRNRLRCLCWTAGVWGFHTGDWGLQGSVWAILSKFRIDSQESGNWSGTLLGRLFRCQTQPFSGIGEDSWESLGLQRDPTSPSSRKSVLNVHWKDWCWNSFGHLMWKTDSLEDPDAGKDWRQEEKGITGDEMVGWHHQLEGHEFEQARGVGDGQGRLACCSPWGCKESNTTEWLNWTDWDPARVSAAPKLLDTSTWVSHKSRKLNGTKPVHAIFLQLSSVLGTPAATPPSLGPHSPASLLAPMSFPCCPSSWPPYFVNFHPNSLPLGPPLHPHCHIPSASFSGG